MNGLEAGDFGQIGSHEDKACDFRTVILCEFLDNFDVMDVVCHVFFSQESQGFLNFWMVSGKILV